MYSPRINDEYIPILYRKAKARKIPMTRLVNEIIKNALTEPLPLMVCSNCLSVLETDDNQKVVYCDKCETVVFTERKVS